MPESQHTVNPIDPENLGPLLLNLVQENSEKVAGWINGEMLCKQPAMAAPRLSASMAGPEREPKLMAEMFTTEAGRKAAGRLRHSPRTF